MKHRTRFILLFLCTLLCLPQPALAQTTARQTSELDNLDRQLVLELIKFSQFNVNFRLKSNYHQKWRIWSYALGREAGTAATLGGTLTDITQQAKGLSNLRNISKSAVKLGIASSLTGNAISGSASSLELVQNTWVMWHAKRDGFSPRTSIAYIKKLMNSTDAIFEQRAQIISLEPSSDKREMYELENTLLQRIRQQLLFEFLTWSVHSRNQAWRENFFYAVDALDSFTRMAAVILARKALDDRSFARSAAVCALIANAGLTLNPIASTLVGRLVGSYQQHKLAKQFPFERPSIPEDIIAQLKQLQAQSSPDKPDAELTELIELGARSQRIDAALERETKEIERYRQIAQQQTIVGPIIGMTALASSILSTVAIFDFADKPKTANKLGFSGRISQCSGQVAALVYTPLTVIRGMILSKRLKSRGELPEQLLRQRLERLDRLEMQLTSNTP